MDRFAIRGKRAPKGKMVVHLGGETWDGDIDEWEVVNTFKEASRVVSDFIDEYDLGGRTWWGGNISNDRGENIAHVSYNGRVWEGPAGGTGLEIKAAKTRTERDVGRDLLESKNPGVRGAVSVLMRIWNVENVDWRAAKRELAKFKSGAKLVRQMEKLPYFDVIRDGGYHDIPAEDKDYVDRAWENLGAYLGKVEREMVDHYMDESNVIASDLLRMARKLVADDVVKRRSFVAAHAQKGSKWYVDTAFINAVQNVYPNSRLEHLGFGEFYLSTPDGNLEFDRMRGQDFEGQSGRSHLIYDNAGGKVVKKAIKLMERSGKSKEAADKWEKLPKGWTDASRKKYWETMTGDVKHKVTKCIKEMTGKVDDAGAFCAALADRVEGKGWRSEKRKGSRRGYYE
jgi:hypothetical protein